MNRRAFVESLTSVLLAAAAAGCSRSERAASGVGALATGEEGVWGRLRNDFYMPPGEAFFNTGTLGAVPKPVLESMIAHMRQIETTLAHWDYTPEKPEWFSGYRPEFPLRTKLAALINAAPEEIALTQNATMGMNFVAHGLDLQSGDEVVTTDQEHPGGRCGWELRVKRHGLVWKQVKMPVPPSSPADVVGLFAAAVTPRTRVVSVPHIVSFNGAILPVDAICRLAHEHGAFAVVDGAQAIGQIRVDVHAMGCDAYFSSPHKWLLAPPGNGFLYVRKAALPEVWTTLASSQWNNDKDGAWRLMQFGTGNLSLLYGLEAAIDYHERIGGPDRVQMRILGLAGRLRAGLSQIPRAKLFSPTHPQMAGAITTWGIAGLKGRMIQDELWTRDRIRVRAVGDSAVRQSCHIYNSPAEVDRTIAIARDLAG